MGTVQEFLNQSSYRADFEGLAPATTAFNAKWRELANADPVFAEAQHDFIQGRFYDVQMGRLQQQGLDLSDRGPAVQDALWSTSVQFRNLTPGIFANGLKEKFGEDFNLSELSDRDIVEAVQDYKINHNNRLFRSSPELWPGLLQRAENEKADLVRLAEQDRSIGQENSNTERSQQSSGRAGPLADGLLRNGEKGEPIRELQQNLHALGFTGRNGQPLTADGDFGANTEHAVRAYQRDHGLTVDGIAGPKTLESIQQQRLEQEQSRTQGQPTTAAQEATSLVDRLLAGRLDPAAQQAWDRDVAACRPCPDPVREQEAQQQAEQQAGLAR